MQHYTVTAVGTGGTEFVYKAQAKNGMLAACEAYGQHGVSLREGTQTEPLGPTHTVELDIVATILASPEGGTLRLDGGSLPTEGYFVGGIVSALIYQGDDESDIAEFAAYLHELTDAEFIGWWTDQETGQLWIDGSDHFLLEPTARIHGSARKEIAIFDIENQVEIRL